jgi:signal transduction histidine kinase
VYYLRTRLIAAFFIATILPLGATIWIASSLITRSLGYATTPELDRLSRTLEVAVRQFYQRERERLREDALAGRIAAARFDTADRSNWTEALQSFWQGAESERFGLSGAGGNHLDFMRKNARGVEIYSRDLGGLRLQELSAEFGRTRQTVAALEARDLRRGFTLALLVLIGVVWLVSLAPLVLLADRVSRPIQQLTAGLSDFAAGNWNRRLEPGRRDEVGRAVDAFNHMAGELRRSRDRLVYLTRMSSWQSLARKTAHELKNSLTPIRLTVEEMLARQPAADRAFMAQAAHIVISEIEALEARVRAFSEFASEPPVRPEVLDMNALVAERVSLLRAAHLETSYRCRLDDSGPRAYASADLVKGILTNLMENAAEAAGPGGTVLVATRAKRAEVVVEVHDSGPGLSPEATATLFEPTITFKKRGMGLGLSIAKKHALVSGGDIALVDGELGGAGFSVTLPAAIL